MIEYTVSSASSERHMLDIIHLILETSTVRQLLFPAKLPVRSGEYIRLASPEQFEISEVPTEFFSETVARIPLYGDNGVKFSLTIYLEETVSPDVVLVKFTSEHWENGLVTYSSLVSLLQELIPVFRIDHAMINCRGASPPTNWEYFSGPTRKYPRRLGWFTYFGPELIAFIGHDNFSNLPSGVEKVELNDGLVVVLQKEPYNPDNPLDEERRRQTEMKVFADLAE